MFVIHKIKYQMTREDYFHYVKPQLKAKKIRLRHIGEKAGFSRQAIQEQLIGKNYLPIQTLDVLREFGIVLPLTCIKVIEE